MNLVVFSSCFFCFIFFQLIPLLFRPLSHSFSYDLLFSAVFIGRLYIFSHFSLQPKLFLFTSHNERILFDKIQEINLFAAEHNSTFLFGCFFHCYLDEDVYVYMNTHKKGMKNTERQKEIHICSSHTHMHACTSERNRKKDSLLMIGIEAILKKY